MLRFKTHTCTTKSRPRKSAMVLGSRVRPHTNLRKSERSVLEKDSITSQNHWMSGAVGSTPLYVATDFSRCNGISGLPHTWKHDSDSLLLISTATGGYEVQSFCVHVNFVFYLNIWSVVEHFVSYIECVCVCVCLTSHHGLQLISSEKREERNRHHASHTFSDSSHLLIELMQPETHTMTSSYHLSKLTLQLKCFTSGLFIN